MSYPESTTLSFFRARFCRGTSVDATPLNDHMVGPGPRDDIESASIWSLRFLHSVLYRAFHPSISLVFFCTDLVLPMDR